LVATRFGLVLLACVTALIYFQWRLGVMNPAYPVYSWIVFAGEIIGFLRALMFLHSAVKLPHHPPPAAAVPGLTVDVFIPTYDEPFDIVQRTVSAAVAIRYPHETWLLDDGGRDEMRELAKHIGCNYVARGEHADAKAGNLNNALSLARGEFVAIFDADHVADPRFLDNTLGHFTDERLAYVQTPQEFFNTGSFEHLRPERTMSNGASFFHRVVQYSRDASNATIYSGSAAVLRRRALDEISGFATGSISEDVHTSLRLHAAGWHSRFHPEILSAGMSPLSAAAYRSQRRRWAQDSLQLLARNFFTLRGLTSGQRLAYFFLMASHLEGWRHLFIYALPIVILVTGIVPLQTDAASFLIRFVPYYLATTLACSELGRGHLRPNESAIYNLARCPSSILATFTAHRVRRWRVTPKASAKHGRSFEDAFPCAVLLATSAAVVFACGQALAGRSPLAPGALVVVIAWAAYHISTAAHLLILERRCEQERRTATRFDESFAATIRPVDDPSTPYVADVVAASANGLTLRVPDGLPQPSAGRYAGVIDLDGSQFAFRLAFREAGSGGAVQWADEAAGRAFDLLLHQRMNERFRATDLGDSGGVLRSAPVNRRRYPIPRPDLASKMP
jgi:cellulose synthase (UDP-forming)